MLPIVCLLLSLSTSATLSGFIYPGYFDMKNYFIK
jgi:hypothetical protein